MSAENRVSSSKVTQKGSFFKTFRVNLALRVVLLILSSFLFAAVAFDGNAPFSTLAISISILLQLFGIIRKIETTNQEVVRLLNYIRYDDFNKLSYSRVHGSSFDDLALALDSVMAHFRAIRNEREAQFEFFRNVVEHIKVGIVAFDRFGRVHIYNNAAKQLFKLSSAEHISVFEAVSSQMAEEFQTLNSGSQTLVKIFTDTEPIELSIHASELKHKNERFKLLTIQNIRRELEDKELDAWQNLIRVLTHEIMNSVTPISSLAGTMASEIEDLKIKATDDVIEPEDLADMHTAAEAIERRSHSLIHFVSEFRNMSQLPTPTFSHVRVKHLLQHLITIMQREIHENGITLTLEVKSDSLFITADPVLIEQVLINILKNAIQALREFREQTDKKITLKAGTDDLSRVWITVADNGPGIEKEALDKIFIPFYTTKKYGTGIGLSLSKQIMRQHKGSIGVTTVAGRGSEFTLRF
ncbi:MAG: GHKL domain-containing protein [Cytophagales bacterium]|nr:MAG: GHKL domain-containing protein [Cytophagales bacterium]TAF62087.1 MAG: GHKL domain-containing protein [Cytophagales bacterium]